MRIQPTATFVEFTKDEVEPTLPERFEEIARKFSDRLAVKDEVQAVTYKELNQAANRIAEAIVRSFGKENEPLAVLLDHGAEPIVAFLGLLKAAKIVVTIDPSAPIERIQRILEHSRAVGVVVNGRSLSRVAGALGAGRSIINIDELSPNLSNENPGLRINPDMLAEIVYTSGSTGEPKGVLRSHRFYLPSIKGNAANCVYSNDRFLNLHAATASGFFLDSFRALFAGAAVFPFNTKKNGLSGLADWLVREEITILRAFSSVFRSFASSLDGARRFSRLRRIELGGESLWKSDIDLYKRKFSDDCVLTLVLAGSEMGKICQFEIDKQTKIADDIVPVGRPLEETAVLLLDERLNEVEPGEIGEIAVRSRYLALGYWRDAALTQQKFLADPDGGDARIYLTGDLGRFLPNGCLTHLGRKDFLVKIRGYRVSLVGIEGALLAHPAVKQAAVIALDSEAGEKSLAAYVVARDEPPPTITQLAEFLRQRLPDYMLPSAFVFLKELPQTNGKVDRRSLPQPQRVRPDLDEPCIHANNEVEAKLVRIWEGILDIRPIGIHDNFLDLGGHSLLAVRLFAEIEKEFNKRLPLSSLFEKPTIEHLARVITQATPLTSRSSLVPIQPRGAKRPFFCVHELFGDVLCYMNLARRLGEDRPFYALQARGLDGVEEPWTDIETMAAHYIEEIRTVQPRGPYVLGGFSFGGFVAFEMAQQLRAAGETVNFVALVDSSARFEHCQVRSKWSLLTNFVRDLPSWLIGSFELGRSQWLNLINLKLRAIKAKLPVGLFPAGVESNQDHDARRITDMRELFQFSEHHLKVAQAHHRALRQYKPRVYPGRLTLFRARMQPLFSSHARDKGLGQLTCGGLDIRVVPGNHLAMLREPHVRILAEQLRDCLDKAQTESATERRPIAV